MEARAIAMIAQSVRSLWHGSLATLRLEPSSAPIPQSTSASQKALKRSSTRTTTSYSFAYTNGTQTIQDTRDLATDRAARREALRTAREMANNVSWQSSARGAGWTVLVINPMGQQI